MTVCNVDGVRLISSNNIYCLCVFICVADKAKTKNCNCANGNREITTPVQFQILLVLNDLVAFNGIIFG